MCQLTTFLPPKAEKYHNSVQFLFNSRTSPHLVDHPENHKNHIWTKTKNSAAKLRSRRFSEERFSTSGDFFWRQKKQQRFQPNRKQYISVAFHCTETPVSWQAFSTCWQQSFYPKMHWEIQLNPCWEIQPKHPLVIDNQWKSQNKHMGVQQSATQSNKATRGWREGSEEQFSTSGDFFWRQKKQQRFQSNRKQYTPFVEQLPALIVSAKSYHQ